MTIRKSGKALILRRSAGKEHKVDDNMAGSSSQFSIPTVAPLRLRASVVRGLLCVVMGVVSQWPLFADSAPPLSAERDPATWWAYQPLKAVSPPKVSHVQGIQTDVDRFVVRSLQRVGLTLSRPASKSVLLRRLHYDLVGLPPTSAELDRFLEQSSPQAFVDEIERLLASPQYGERWGGHWMDVVRYADTAGDNADYPIPEAYRYRDYIRDAFNRDKPYDQFIREQLAGDLLANQGPKERYAEQVVATGFLALSRRYATAPFELMHLTHEDAIDTTGKAFLGMTLRCARCHDHKSDPITTRDYYGLYGFFASTRFPYAGSEEFQSKSLPRTGFVPLVPAEESARPLEQNRLRLEQLRAELAVLDKSIAAGKSNLTAKSELESKLKTLRMELKRRERSGALPDLPVAYAVGDDRPVEQAIHKKGDPGQLGEIVPRCLPSFLASGSPTRIREGSSGRLEVADWIASPTNRLTARVMVNRIWQHHFGKGLAPTPSNIGLSSEPPTHPELIDFLAVQFLKSGWSVKALHRLILNSAVWQQSSDETSKANSVDPSNRWYGRFTRSRLDAESIRDAMMYAAGTLDLNPPGAHPFPPVEEWHWTQHDPFKAVYESKHRSIYLMRQRIQRHPYLGLFDAPDSNLSSDTRSASNVPGQALYLMNHPFVQEQASAFASRILAQPLSQESNQIKWAIKTAWGVRADPKSIREGMAYLQAYREKTSTSDSFSDGVRRDAWASYCRVLLTSNPFFYVD